MINNEQSPISNNLILEVKIETKQNEPESIINLRNIKERQITEIESFDFRTIGYSEQEIEQNENFRKTFNKYLEESDDDPQKFLDLLEQQGIHTIEKSYFLKTQQTLAQIGEINKSGTNAMFATQAMIRSYLLENFSGKPQEELESLLNYTGVIFLSKNPNKKSIFHEGSHATQYLLAMNMDAKDEKTRLKREIEVSIALIRAKISNKLKSVDRGKCHTAVFKVWGEIANFSANDIYQEVDNFYANKKRLLEIIQAETDNKI
jgi:hypothetical protein